MKRGTRTLLDVIRDATRRSTRAGSKRTLVAFTCYVDETAIKALAKTVRITLKEREAQLVGFRLFIDAGEWAKQRINVSALRKTVARSAGLRSGAIKIGPAWFAGRLFHAKCYALIGRKRDGQPRGCVVLTSGNLTRRGLGLNADSNIELAHVLTEPDALAHIHEIADALAQDHGTPNQFDARQQKVLHRSGYITAPDSVVERWRDPVEAFRFDRERIELNVLRYEKLEDVLDSARRSVVLQMLRGVEDHVLAVGRPQGLKRVMKQFLELEPSARDEADWHRLDRELDAYFRRRQEDAVTEQLNAVLSQMDEEDVAFRRRAAQKIGRLGP